MKYFFSLICLVLSLCSWAQTIEVQGHQSGLWDADTVLVKGQVKVRDSLSIAPGTVVLFDDFVGIDIVGGASFIAQGTADEPILFTVADTTGFSIYNSGKGGWNGLFVDKAGKVRLDYCKLQFGKAADTLDQHGGAMNILQTSDVEITHSTFFCNFSREHGGAINAEGSSIRFSNCAINDNKVYTSDPLYYMYGGGARFLKCDIVMTDMEFLNNYGPSCIGGAMSLDSCSILLDRAVFAHNIGINGGGFYMMRCNDKACRVSNLLIHDNFSGHFGGGMAFADASPEVYNVTVTRNFSEGVNCNGVFYYQHSSPVLVNCIVSGNYPEHPQGDTIQQWIWTFDDYAPEFHNCLFEDGLKQFTGADYIHVAEDIMDLDPGFVDPEHEDFHLSEDSPCRDAGSLQTPDYILASLDLDHMPRVSNQRVDLGPYEYSGANVGETALEASSVELLGNPLNAQSQLRLDLHEAGEVVVRFISLLGQSTAMRSFGRREAGTSMLDLGDMIARLDHGVYLLEVRVNEKNYLLKSLK